MNVKWIELAIAYAPAVVLTVDLLSFCIKSKIQARTPS